MTMQIVSSIAIHIGMQREKIFALREQSYCIYSSRLVTLSAEASGCSLARGMFGTMPQLKQRHNHLLPLVSRFMQRQLAARLEAFVEQPSKVTFLAARNAVLDEYPMLLTAGQIAELDQLLEQEDYQALLEHIDALPPSKVLSPRIHFLAAEAAEALGNPSDTELERCLFVITLRGLLSTGEGTKAQPYIVCHASDEHDILEALGRESSRQAMVEIAGRVCDVLRCADGREMWFDVTQVINPTAFKSSKRCSPRRRRLRPSRISR